MKGGWLLRTMPAVLASLPACSWLIDTDVGVRGGDSDAGGSDDAGDGGSGDAGPCGSIARLQDEFPAGELSLQWVPRRQGSAASEPAIVGDRLRLRFDPVPGPDEYSQVESRFAYDLRAHAVTVLGVEQGAAGWSTLEVRAAGAFDRPRRIIGFGHLEDDLVAFVAGDPIQPIQSTPFDGSQHRYWQIRESGGQLEFLVAGDSLQFSLFTTLADPGLDLGAVMVGLQLFSGEPPSAAIGSTDFDDLNTDAVADPACPVDQLRDDFSAAALGPLWIDNSDLGTCTLTTGGGLTAVVDSGQACIVDSAHAYSFVGEKSLVVDIAEFPADASASTTLLLAHDPENFVQLRQQAGQLEISITERGGVGDSVTLPNPAIAQSWRVTERGGDLIIDTATNGGSFMLRHTLMPITLDLAELRVSFLVQADALAAAELASINL